MPMGNAEELHVIRLSDLQQVCQQPTPVLLATYRWFAHIQLPPPLFDTHIWFCFSNSVANDLTSPYKACLVPLSSRKKEHPRMLWTPREREWPKRSDSCLALNKEEIRVKKKLHLCVFFWDGRSRSLDGVDEILNPDSSVVAFITPPPLCISAFFIFDVSTADVGLDLAKTGAEPAWGEGGGMELTVTEKTLRTIPLLFCGPLNASHSSVVEELLFH